jgi:iron complex transport system ATP-binding protein
MNILEVKNASFSYEKGHRIFENVSLSLQEGQILSIIGPNGSGKSTLLSCLADLLRLKSGEIILEGRPQRSFRKKELARIIGYVPQSYVPTYGYTVRDYVVMGRAPYIGILGSPGKKEYALAEAAIDKMGISRLANRPYTEISGGERQQASIARVLVQEPRIILLDEPTSALDYGNQMRSLELIKELAHQGYTIIMTTHTPDHAIMLNDKTAILDRSGRLHVGNQNEIMKEDILREVYRTNLKLIYVPEAGRVTCLAVNRENPKVSEP